jgi:hypothetical protein
MRRACGLKLPAPRPALRCARRRSGGQGIFLDLFHASERTGTQGQKGPEGRKNLAQGVSPGSRKPSCSREPQRGERRGFDAGTLPGSAAPSGARPALWLGSPGLAPWAKFCRPLGGLPGPPYCCHCKLSQICRAPAAGLPLLCRTPGFESP